MGRDFQLSGYAYGLSFQFTRPAWGATSLPPFRNHSLRFQFTRPAWGATARAQGADRAVGFNSRAPHGARRLARRADRAQPVSIHAPRMGRDKPTRAAARFLLGFNSRAPHGARLTSRAAALLTTAFQFTRPAWGATFWCLLPAGGVSVSIHAPRMGRDVV